MSKIYTIIERHYNGVWWYHPIDGDDCKSMEEAEERANNIYNDRKWRIICHRRNFPNCNFYYRFTPVINSHYWRESHDHVNNKFIDYIKGLFKLNVFF